MDSVPDLTGGLRVLEALKDQPVAPSDGPRQWWNGPLDVEGLALGAVQAAATSLNALVGVPGRYSLASGATAASFDSLGHLRISGVKPEGFAPTSGFRRTSDGWIRLHANYPHHAARLMAALSVSTPQGLEHALLRMTSLAAEAAITANNGVAAAVRTRDEWVATPMYGTASAGPWIRVSRPPTAASGSQQLSRWVPSVVPLRP
nr:hypothetical protein [Pseudarthrobacter psychrotolerans]